MTNYQILSTNILEIDEAGLEAKSREISVAVLTSDILKGVKEPVFYAFRYGMLYNPKNDFSPNIKGKQAIKDYLIESYYQQLPRARDEYSKLLALVSGQGGQGGNEAELDELKQALKDARTRITSQAEQIKELSNKKDNGNQIERLEALIEMQAAATKAFSTMQSNRIEIAIQGKTTKVIEKIVHEKLLDILKLISADEAVYMHGPAGTGKSQIAEDIAEALELVFYPMSTLTQEFKLSGFIDAGGKYHETNFYRAMKHGGVFFLDEMDSCSPDVLVGINGALANGYYDFPIGTVYAHKDFRVIAAGNTIGRGADEGYTGRFALDMSTLDRFLGVEISYSPKIDEAVSNNDNELVIFAHSVRQAAENAGIMILMSYRSISKIAKLSKMDFSLVDVLKMAFIKGVASDDIRMLTRNMNIDSSNKYYKALKQAA
jgi:AAA domain (dynein-related subfamily)